MKYKTLTKGGSTYYRKLKTLIPIKGKYEKDFLNLIFDEISRSGTLVFQEKKEQQLFFLNPQDLAGLLYKVFDNWNEKEDSLNIPNVFKHTFQDFGKKLNQSCPFLKIAYTGESILENMPEDDKVIRYQYGWETVRKSL